MPFSQTVCFSIFCGVNRQNKRGGCFAQKCFFGPDFWGHASCPWRLIPSWIYVLWSAAGVQRRNTQPSQESGVVQGPRKRRRKWGRWRKRIWGTVHLQEADWSAKVEQSISCHTRIFSSSRLLIRAGGEIIHPMASCRVPKSVGSKA